MEWIFVLCGDFFCEKLLSTTTFPISHSKKSKDSKTQTTKILKILKIKLLLIGAFIIIYPSAFSENKVGNDTIIKISDKSYQFKYDLQGTNLEERVVLTNGKFMNEFVSVGQYEVTQGYKIKVLYEKNGNVYYRYWNFRDSTKQKKYNGDKIFRMEKNNFVETTQPLYSKYKGAKVGAYTVPFRLRGIGSEDFDFETALSLQANVAFGFGKITQENSCFDVSWGLGLTRVDLNSKNSLVTENRTATALTTSLGIVIKPEKYVNLGVFIGWDFLGKNDQDIKWIYNNKPWLGVGINISFDEIKTDKSANNLNNP